MTSKWQKLRQNDVKFEKQLKIRIFLIHYMSKRGISHFHEILIKSFMIFFVKYHKMEKMTSTWQKIRHNDVKFQK